MIILHDDFFHRAYMDSLVKEWYERNLTGKAPTHPCLHIHILLITVVSSNMRRRYLNEITADLLAIQSSFSVSVLCCGALYLSNSVFFCQDICSTFFQPFETVEIHKCIDVAQVQRTSVPCG